MKEITTERMNSTVWLMTSGYYSFNSNATVGTIAKKASKMVVDNYPEFFGNNLERVQKHIEDKDMTVSFIDKDENGNYPIRDARDVIEAAASVVREDLAKFFIDPDAPVEDHPTEDVHEEQTVEVDNQATDSDNNMAKIDFGFGTPFDPEQINKEMAEQFDPSNPARAFIQKPTEFQQPIPQVIPEQYGYYNPPVYNQQPIVNPNPNYNPQQAVPNYAPPQPVIHKVDEAPKPKKAPPAEDKVDHNLEKIQIDGLKKPPVVKQQPEIIQTLEPAAPVDNTVVNMYDNSEIANKYTKIPLLEIQAIANLNSCSVKFEEYPHEGIIAVSTFDHMVGQPVAPKSFCIDTGMIIDKRAKLIATNPVFNAETMLEQAPMYELFTNSSNGNKKVLDTKMINDFFVAGVLNVTKKEMYSESYKALNMKLALITLPTKGLNKEERNSLQDYIVKMDQDGYFDKAIQMAPGSRFVFVAKQLAKNALADFILINQGVPRFYGTEPLKVMPVIIESKAGKISIRTAGQQ